MPVFNDENSHNLPVLYSFDRISLKHNDYHGFSLMEVGISVQGRIFICGPPRGNQFVGARNLVINPLQDSCDFWTD